MTPVCFFHRNDSSGTFDSICLICSQIAARMGTESELIKEEAQHLSDAETFQDQEPEKRLWD
jgi:hypothetical protein